MPISINLSSSTSTATAKISDVNALLAAINTELALYPTRAQYDQLAAKVAALEARVDTVEDRPDLTARVAALEVEPDPVLPPDLTARVEALERLVQRVPAESPAPIVPSSEPLPRPANLNRDRVELVYDHATLYYGDLELHAQRIDERKWRLYAQLNYVVISPVLWTYDEIVEGTPEEVYAHASRRIAELAKLKPQHDAVHDRVRAMSEGR